MMRSLGFMVWVATFLVIGAAIGYWRLDNQIPFDYVAGELAPMPAVMGEQVTTSWQVKINRVCPGAVHRQIFKADDANATPISYDRTPSALSVNKNSKEIIKSFTLPPNFPKSWNVDGMATVNLRYTAIVYFECNFLQKFFPLRSPTPDLFFTAKSARVPTY